jgi:hypothetical protein
MVAPVNNLPYSGKQKEIYTSESDRNISVHESHWSSIGNLCNMNNKKQAPKATLIFVTAC